MPSWGLWNIFDTIFFSLFFSFFSFRMIIMLSLSLSQNTPKIIIPNAFISMAHQCILVFEMIRMDINNSSVMVKIEMCAIVWSIWKYWQKNNKILFIKYTNWIDIHIEIFELLNLSNSAEAKKLNTPYAIFNRLPPMCDTINSFEWTSSNMESLFTAINYHSNKWSIQ